MRIYIAGPYTIGDVALNVRAAIQTADYIATRGHIPFVPHLTHFWHMVCPRPYEDWLKIDMVWLEQSEAMIRLAGRSAGADKEVAHARELGIPVLELVEGHRHIDSLNKIDEWLAHRA